MTPEGRVKQAGRRLYRELDLYWFAVQQGPTSPAGIPDDMLCVNGLFVQIEYKAHMRWDKRHRTAFATLPSEKQVLNMQRARLAGGVTFVVDDIGLPYLPYCLERLLQMEDMSIASVSYLTIDLPLLWTWTLKEFTDYKRGQGDAIFLSEDHPVPRYRENLTVIH